METKKTDNHALEPKLELRRYFLRKYHAGPQAANRMEPVHVLDCCQASGRIWNALLAEGFLVDSYWGIDLKPKKGRLQVDSVRVLDQPGWTQNVVDIDAYGSPWKHYFALLRNCRHAVTVFLTAGMVKVGGGNYDRALLPVLGMDFKQLELPNSIGARLNSLAIRFALVAKSAYGLQPVEAKEAGSNGSARYLGIRLEPR